MKLKDLALATGVTLLSGATIDAGNAGAAPEPPKPAASSTVSAGASDLPPNPRLKRAMAEIERKMPDIPKCEDVIRELRRILGQLADRTWNAHCDAKRYLFTRREKRDTNDPRSFLPEGPIDSITQRRDKAGVILEIRDPEHGDESPLPVHIQCSGGEPRC